MKEKFKEEKKKRSLSRSIDKRDKRSGDKDKKKKDKKDKKDKEKKKKDKKEKKEKKDKKEIKHSDEREISARKYKTLDEEAEPGEIQE